MDRLTADERAQLRRLSTMLETEARGSSEKMRTFLREVAAIWRLSATDGEAV